MIYTYQDLLNAGEVESERMKFCETVIESHKNSDEVKFARIAHEYDCQRNVTIMEYQKLLYTLTGEAVPDNFSANHKCASNFFHRFVVQKNQYLLGNGIAFVDEEAKNALGGDKFDVSLKQAGRQALVAGVAFGFYNLDHVEVFKLTEFAPLYDEEDGTLKAGIRFWRLADTKPLRYTLYEMDGYTDYIKRAGKETEVLNEKRPYIREVQVSEADGEEILSGRNYPTFPIVPLYANETKQSLLVGMKENIDCYDLIKSGMANDLDDASLIYWTLENAGGMDDIDLVKFVERMKTVKAAVVDGDGGAKAEAHTLDVPSASRESYLTRLEADMYRDAMALNTNAISGGNITATAIMAAYDPMDGDANEFEDGICQFVDGLLFLAGYTEDVQYSFKRSRVANQMEETQMVLSAAQYLDAKTILRHLPFLAGDEIDEVYNAITKDEAGRYGSESETDEVPTEENANNTGSESESEVTE